MHKPIVMQDIEDWLSEDKLNSTIHEAKFLQLQLECNEN